MLLVTVGDLIECLIYIFERCIGAQEAAASMDCQQILHGHDAEWQPALHHDFLKRCKDGSVPAAAFNKWLEQDHHFVTDFRSASS